MYNQQNVKLIFHYLNFVNKYFDGQVPKYNGTPNEVDKAIEAMYKNAPYGLYKYGYIEDLEQITNEQIFKRYKEILSMGKIDIYISGIYNEEEIEKAICENENIKNLQAHKPNYIINNEETETKTKVENIQNVTEKLDVTQGKLILGLDILTNEKNSRFAISIYNAILGGSANSKLFQNVREKASLAYTCGSNYIRQKNNILIRAGIEIENYEKALEITKQQIEEMKQGNFTEEELENAKKYIINGIKAVEEGQDSEITYYMGLELSNLDTTLKEYEENIKAITKENVVEIANKVSLNTIYFLRN